MVSNSKKTVFLSHPWGPSAPAYGGGLRISLKSVRALKDGDTCNTLEFAASNHAGTHMDFPAHFHKEGATCTEYPPETFLHTSIALSWFEVSPSEIIDFAKIKKNLLLENTDPTLLLIRTGFSKKRSQDDYWERGPGLSPDIADGLRKEFPSIRMIGVDTISITSFQNRELGRVAHRSFLCSSPPILLIEDMHLEPLEKRIPKSVIAMPLRIEGGDAAAATVVAEL